MKVSAVDRAGDGGEVTLTLDGEPRSLIGDELLVAVGRRPRTDDLGLDTIGLPGDRYLSVYDRLRVEGHPWLFAIGDVNGRALLTHMGKYQARIASRVIDGDEGARTSQDGPGSPRVIFTDPHVAAVGLTEAAAREAEIDVLVISQPTAGTPARALSAATPPGRRSSSSIARATSSSARRSSARRSRSSCTPPRLRSSLRSRTGAWCTACPHFRRAARSGSRCWMPGRVRLHATDLRESP